MTKLKQIIIYLVMVLNVSTEHSNLFVFQITTIDTNNFGLILRSEMIGELNIINGANTWWNYLTQ